MANSILEFTGVVLFAVISRGGLSIWVLRSL